MRTWIIDQFEFEDSQSEEALEVIAAIQSDFPFSDVAKFVATAVGEQAARNLVQPSPFDERSGGATVRKYLERFTGLSLPSPCNWPTHVISDEWNECHLVICGPGQFISYRWSTSA